MSSPIDSLLNEFVFDPDSIHPRRQQETIFLARALLHRSQALRTPEERRRAEQLDRMLHHPKDKSTLFQITDQVFRPRNAARAVDQFRYLLKSEGTPHFFKPWERTLLSLFQSFGGILPTLSLALVKEKIRSDARSFVLSAEEPAFTKHLQKRHAEGIRINVNFLGEALLGEKDAAQRHQRYLDALDHPEIEVLSVKISTLDSQISPLARRQTIDRLVERLTPLFRKAGASRFRRTNGTEVAKFIYLDMEEYQDLFLTAEAFIRTLDQPELKSVSAGIALQAYLPDSFLIQQELTTWAQERVAAGGAPITIRIVKGANLEMERIEAAHRGWPQAPFLTKPETDSHYKRMLEYGLRPENRNAVHLGIASHNLFEIAHALLHVREANAFETVQLEMLEGMANAQVRALGECGVNLLLYAPACRSSEFLNAIAYLVRRLDENTGPENFLRHAQNLSDSDASWNTLAETFHASCHLPLQDQPRRTQNRLRPEGNFTPRASFENEPDTDFSLLANSDWALDLLTNLQRRLNEEKFAIPVVVGGKEFFTSANSRGCHDPSRPGVILGRYATATREQLALAIQTTREDPTEWRKSKWSDRREALERAAHEISRSRGDLIGMALANAGKIISEGDAEVSEAIDFIRYYVRTADSVWERTHLEIAPRGTVVVLSPWNFPIAIPCGGIAAALCAGNHVILKPSSDAVMVAWELCHCFWKAGIPKTVLQFVPCSGALAEENLLPHADAAILTGGTETAERIQTKHPSLFLMAETGGKNAMIVTAMADREQAIKHLVQSAFSHSGQKCSATSLLLLEAELYDDPGFREALRDAVKSLKVGSAWDLATRVGPLIRPPLETLHRGLTTLEPGEEWLVAPESDPNHPELYSPGVKWGVQRGSFTHTTELFGPVIGVMRFQHLDEAIQIVHQTGYGLTAGLQSLDKREQKRWRSKLRVGNLYLNRPTTGAIVGRQPFGGFAKSVFGPGVKAGGPNYLFPLFAFGNSRAPERKGELPSDLQESLAWIKTNPPTGLTPSEMGKIEASVRSLYHAFTEEFSKTHNDWNLLGQENLRRYLPWKGYVVRLDPRDTPLEMISRLAAARISGASWRISTAPGHRLAPWLTQFLQSWHVTVKEENDPEMIQEMSKGKIRRLRYAAPGRASQNLLQAAATSGVFVDQRPVLLDGRIELLGLFQEQTICIETHRYGNLKPDISHKAEQTNTATKETSSHKGTKPQRLSNRHHLFIP